MKWENESFYELVEKNDYRSNESTRKDYGEIGAHRSMVFATKCIPYPAEITKEYGEESVLHVFRDVPCYAWSNRLRDDYNKYQRVFLSPAIDKEHPNICEDVALWVMTESLWKNCFKFDGLNNFVKYGVEVVCPRDGIHPAMWRSSMMALRCIFEHPYMFMRWENEWKKCKNAEQRAAIYWIACNTFNYKIKRNTWCFNQMGFHGSWASPHHLENFLSENTCYSLDKVYPENTMFPGYIYPDKKFTGKEQLMEFLNVEIG